MEKIAGLVATLVVVLTLAACGGSGGGWSAADRERAIASDMEAGYSRETAECFADFYETTASSYDEMMASSIERAAEISLGALAACDAEIPE